MDSFWLCFLISKQFWEIRRALLKCLDYYYCEYASASNVAKVQHVTNRL